MCFFVNFSPTQTLNNIYYLKLKWNRDKTDHELLVVNAHHHPNCPLRDCGGHLTWSGYKLWSIQENIQVGFSPYISIFALHLIYHLNKYNINILMCYTLQYSQYAK